LKTWARWIGYTALGLLLVLPWVAIALGRAERSASAPAVLEQVWPLSNGRFTIGAFSFTVDGQVYRGQDEEDATPTRGSRTWSEDEIVGMHVCYDPERPGEEFAIAPARYRCGNPEIFTTDGGW
jgi:hypothetical protein